MDILGKLSSFKGKNIEEAWELVAQQYYAKLLRRRSPVMVRVGHHRRPVHHRSSFSDIMAIWQCFHKKQYSMPVQFFGARHHSDLMALRYSQIVGAGKTPLIVDCGANIGASAIWFCTMYREATVVALEPETGNVLMLRKNTASLGVSVLHAGIGPQDGTAAIHDTGTGSMGFQTRPSDRADAIPIVSLASLMRSYPASVFVPFILKLDVEGAERNLFEADPEEFDKFPLIIVELHDFMMPGQATSRSFLRYHAERGRDFIYHMENVFSFNERQLQSSLSAQLSAAGHGQDCLTSRAEWLADHAPTTRSISAS